MEGFVNLILFLMLCIGIFLSFFKKARIIGIIMVLITLVFLFILPIITFWIFKKESVGTYTDKIGKEIIINSYGNYKIMFNGKPISNGEIVYSNIDSYTFSFDNNSELISITKGEITEFNNRKIIYLKVK